MLSFKNFFAHPLTTLYGAIVGCFQAGTVAAVATYAQTGNTTDWKPYAAAAVAGAVPVLIGGLMPSTTTAADTPIVFTPATTTDSVQGKVAIMASVDAALAQVAQAAMVAEASKLTGVDLSQH